MARIFISHAVVDKPIVEAFVTLLQTGLDISQKDIFCSSIEGMKIRPGKSFVEFIRGQLSHADYVIMIVTPAYYESAFCMCELGASWIQAKDAYPLLVPPITYDNLKAVLHGVHCGKITDAQDLNQLNDCMSDVGIVKATAARWELRRDVFLNDLPKLLKKLKQQSLIPAADHDKLKEKYQGAQDLLKEHGEEIEALKEQIEELKKLKDKEAVKKVVRKGRSEREQFDELTEAFCKATKGVPNCVVEVMFHTQNDKSYSGPSGWGRNEEWDELRTAEDRGMLILDGNSVKVKSSAPKLRKAYKALEDLDVFLSNASCDLFEEIEEEFEFECSLENKDFWQEFLGLI